jgi:hypothetical protein
MIDASKGFIKDGNKNRLREQDIHRIVDTFTRQAEQPPLRPHGAAGEIADPKNDFNLNLPRYIDSTEPEDLQDIDGHLRGGIPARPGRLRQPWPLLAGAARRARHLVRSQAAPATPACAAAARGQTRHLRPCRVHRLQPDRHPALCPLAQAATATLKLKAFGKAATPRR